MHRNDNFFALLNCIDGLGYYDDGEEHVFDPEEDANKKQSKIRTGAHATLSANANALKKARKANELLESASLNKQQKGSMWSFVKRGASAATINESSQVFDKKNSAMSAAKLDSLLAALDDPLILPVRVPPFLVADPLLSTVVLQILLRALFLYTTGSDPMNIPCQIMIRTPPTHTRTTVLIMGKMTLISTLSKQKSLWNP
jgi:hypothetical protein